MVSIQGAASETLELLGITFFFFTVLFTAIGRSHAFISWLPRGMLKDCLISCNAFQLHT